MAEQEIDAKQLESRVLDLKEAMDRMKKAQADRDDVVVDMKQSVQVRLELLAKDLQPVFDAVPQGNDQFEFALTNGETPRLWIDMTSFVRMGRDRRTYEFVKDTRLGRAILAESDQRDMIAKSITDYVAERVLERERAIEGDWQAMKAWDFDRRTAITPAVTATIEPAPRKTGSRWWHLVTLLVGAAIGAVGMVAWAWFGEPPQF